jgi:hypothetical protein
MVARGVVAIAIAALQTAPLTPIAAQEASPGSYARGRILVMPRPGLPEAELAKIVGVHGGKATKITSSGLHVVELPPNASEQSVAALLAHHPHLKFAEIDRKMPASFTPNDPYFGSEWHAAKIGAPGAWDSTRGSGVTIAILDTGVDGTHPDLAAQLVPGWNFYANNSSTSDPHGHGTWVSGTAGGTDNNGIGVAAIAGNAKIMPIVVADATATAYASTISQGISYAIDHGARVANISYQNLLTSSSVISAAQYMKSKNGLVVIAAGNCGCNGTFTPSTSMISVSATDANDQITSFSSYGSYVSISAPGIDIYTTTVGGGYSTAWGTSFSSPVVAATVALMMSANPSLANTQIESLLYSTATDLGASGRDMYYGYGRVNAAAAVLAVLGAPTTTADTQAPTASISSPAAAVTVSGLVPVDVSASDNVGVTKVELRVNGAPVASDTTSPYGFSWDSTSVANGTVTLTAVAYDGAGNSAVSVPVSVNIANATVLPPPPPPSATDSTPPVVKILSPASGPVKAKGSVSITTSASDDSGTSGITQTLYIDGVLKATASGGSLSYAWNVNKVASGAHTIQVVGKDAAGNTSSASTQVSK